MVIKVKKLTDPLLREIKFQCPGCGATCVRWVPLETIKGEGSCGCCNTEFQWEEVEDEVSEEIPI